MTDWDRVEKLRAKGLDWEAIAEDPKVEFKTEVRAGTAGRALKALYLERKSKRRRSGRSSGGDAEESDGGSARARWPTRLIVAGIVLLLLGGIWALIATFEPIARALVPLIPYIVGIVVLGAVLLGASFVLGGSFRDLTSVRKVIVVGVVLGLVVAGSAALIAYFLGIPVLNSCSQSEPNGWCRAHNAAITDGGHPQLLFIGSIACPYCSASSWAIFGALQAFGSLNSYSYGASNPADTFPHTPEVELDSSGYSSNYVSWDVKEGSNPNQITEPALSTVESAYVSAYDQGLSIPFLVVDGIFIHVGTLIDPSQLTTAPGQPSGTGSPLSYQQVQADIASQSGPVYSTIITAQYSLEAFLWKACSLQGITPPASVTSNPQVHSDYLQIA
ncbi:MAG TPA: DUF929 family protein [Thermoplasmata archaeon]|nr:DUF929 family protein [Thermoplasmata archaeon]